MLINGKFLRSDDLGRKLHHLIAMDWTIKVEVDRFGTGTMYFEHPQYCTNYIEFTEFNTNDWVEIDYNELGEIKRIEN